MSYENVTIDNVSEPEDIEKLRLANQDDYTIIVKIKKNNQFHDAIYTHMNETDTKVTGRLDFRKRTESVLVEIIKTDSTLETGTVVHIGSEKSALGEEENGFGDFGVVETIQIQN